MKKISKQEVENRELKAKQKKERKEQLEREIKTTPVPEGISGIKERISKLEELLGYKEE